MKRKFPALALLWLSILFGRAVLAAPNETVPAWAGKAFHQKHLDQKYELYSWLKPSCLEGHFSGRSELDAAILIRQKATGKAGIAVFHRKTGQVFIIGAGRDFGNGGDDFSWMDVWGVEVRRKAEGKRPPQDVLSATKSQSAGGLIVWDGKKYLWEQNGD